MPTIRKIAPLTAPEAPKPQPTKPSADLRANWQRVRFGDVVRNVDVNERNPLENGIERYVGLDHLDPESLHIKRWGLVADGTTFTRKFRPGQVLFGKRRAYQRKAAVAEFEGICSGDILVFEPSSDELLADLLPFIVQSDGFFEHALGTSAGSLSPRTKWKDLADYEFALPPRDEQHRIAEILWAADEAVTAMEDVLTRAELARSLLLDAMIQQGIGHKDFKETSIGLVPRSWQVLPAQKVCEAVIDCKNRTPPQTTSGYPVVRTTNIRNGRFIFNDLTFTDKECILPIVGSEGGSATITRGSSSKCYAATRRQT